MHALHHQGFLKDNMSLESPVEQFLLLHHMHLIWRYIAPSLFPLACVCLAVACSFLYPSYTITIVSMNKIKCSSTAMQQLRTDVPTSKTKQSETMFLLEYRTTLLALTHEALDRSPSHKCMWTPQSPSSNWTIFTNESISHVFVPIVGNWKHSEVA
jgi:hypothetical protein